MAQVTLDAPLTLDPQQATRLVLRETEINHRERFVRLVYELLDAQGRIIDRRVRVARGAAAQNWITNQETTLYNRLLAELGVTGTVT